MRTIAILPVKSFGAAKQRLSEMLGAGSRQALAQAMLTDVLGALAHVEAIEATLVVTSDRLAESLALTRGVQVLRDPVEAGQSAAALTGVQHALAEGFERALLVPGDTPLLDAGEVQKLLDGAPERGVAIVPDRHGSGTNALVLSPPDAIGPSFGPESFERHLAAARSSTFPHTVEHVPSLALDVDTQADLSELAALLEGRRGSAAMTRGALRQLDRMHPRARVASTRHPPTVEAPA
jgi:2-phospho-L-lactate/phosphoenolpyruvate guanylyltransferase